MIEAIKFTDKESFKTMILKWGDSFDSVARFKELGFLRIDTLEGTHTATKGDYVIKGVKGEFYPCKPYIFEMTYEKINQLEHIESKDCWCEPTLIQAIDDEHDCEVWSHKGHEELNQ